MAKIRCHIAIDGFDHIFFTLYEHPKELRAYHEVRTSETRVILCPSGWPAIYTYSSYVAVLMGSGHHGQLGRFYRNHIEGHRNSIRAMRAAITILQSIAQQHGHTLELSAMRGAPRRITT